MFAVAVIPGVFMILGFMIVPESVRFLVKAGRRDEARAVVEEIEGPDDAPQVLADIEQSLAQEQAEQADWSELITPGLRRPLIIGIGLSVIQQITGINAIIYYANDIFAKAGFESSSGAVAGHPLCDRPGERSLRPSSRLPTSIGSGESRCSSTA